MQSSHVNLRSGVEINLGCLSSWWMRVLSWKGHTSLLFRWLLFWEAYLLPKSKCALSFMKAESRFRMCYRGYGLSARFTKEKIKFHALWQQRKGRLSCTSWFKSEGSCLLCLSALRSSACSEEGEGKGYGSHNLALCSLWADHEKSFSNLKKKDILWGTWEIWTLKSQCPEDRKKNSREEFHSLFHTLCHTP